MSKLIDREESFLCNGIKYDFILYWGKDAGSGGLFGMPPSLVGITKWFGSKPTDFKTIHVWVDTGRTGKFWISEKDGFFGETLWEKRIDEDINTIPLEKVIEYIPSYAK